MEWLKENWLRLILGIALITVAASLFYYFVILLPSIQENSRSSAAQKYNLDSQEKCTKQAEKNFKDQDAETEGKISNSYVSHYNQKLNKCFILIHRTFLTNSTYFIDEILSDAYGGEGYAEYDSSFSGGDSADLRSSCRLLDKTCKTEKEFNDFINIYMEGVGIQ